MVSVQYRTVQYRFCIFYVPLLGGRAESTQSAPVARSAAQLFFGPLSRAGTAHTQGSRADRRHLTPRFRGYSPRADGPAPRSAAYSTVL